MKTVVQGLFLTLLVFCFTSVSQAASSFTPAPSADEGKGLVYIYRVGAYPTLRKPKVLVDGQLLFSPREKSYTWVQLPVGKHEIIVNWAWDTGWPDLKFDIDVTEDTPLFLKISGSFQNLGKYYQVGSQVTPTPGEAATEELKICCKYMAPKSTFLKNPE